MLAAIATLFATSAVAQKSPQLYSWNTGWSADAKGLKHVLGLRCPTAPWKGLSPVAPIGFDTDKVAGTTIHAECQYYQYYDQGTPKETRFVVNLIRVPSVAALAAGWALNARGGAPTFDMVTRGKARYRVAIWKDDPGHRTLMIARDKGEAGGGEGIVILAIVPLTWTDAKIWPVFDGMFAANP